MVKWLKLNPWTLTAISVWLLTFVIIEWLWLSHIESFCLSGLLYFGVFRQGANGVNKRLDEDQWVTVWKRPESGWNKFTEYYDHIRNIMEEERES